MICTIPNEALPIVEILRRDVVRPRHLPTIINFALRWLDYSRSPVQSRCPLGLHKDSQKMCPWKIEQFAGGICKDRKAFASFMAWWDRQRDAVYASDQIWGMQ
jgi:hypothetical protein